MDPMTRSQLPQLLKERSESIAEAWYEAALGSHNVLLNAAQVQVQFASWTRQIIELLLADPLARGKAEAIGEALVQFRALQPEVLGRTSRVLLLGVATDLTPEQAAVLEPRLAVLLEGVATGFCRRVAKTLQESKERYQIVSELVSDYAFSVRVEPDGTLVPEWATEAHRRITGYTLREALLGGTWERLVHPDDRGEVAASFREWSANRPRVVKYRMETRKGETRWVRTYLCPVWNKSRGRVERVYGAVQDITDQKKAEETLRESEERWRSLVENAPDIILIADRSGEILFLNRSPSGLDVRTVVGKNLIDYVVPEQRAGARESLARVFETGQPEYHEVSARLSSGDVAWYAARLGAIYRGDEVRATVVIGRNITEQKRVEQVKDNLVRDVSHELRTPLAKLQMGLDLLLETLQKEELDRERIARMGHMVRDNVERLSATVETMLDLSVLEAGRKVYDMAELSAAELIDDVVADMQPLVHAKGLELVTDLPEDMPRLWGDRERLFRVLTNLVDNAVKFSDHGSIVISATMGPEELEFSVRDEGRGILPEHLDQVFERFYQEKVRFHGAGIGLAIYRTIVGVHGGRIWAESAGRNLGTVVRFTLPILAEREG
jgi:PAS domain S-box-containing protein